MADTERYDKALEWLFAQLPMFSRVGAAAYKPGLERVKRLSDAFGNPERKLKAIHIAGTNGKGSTSHMIASILQAQGYKIALYTSPHLVDFRERMRINGEMIPRERVADFVERWQNSDYDGDRPSFFELTMMMAFDWFVSEDADYAVIETGMGGRLDSTNIISPLACVITNISADHTQFLGDTLPQIASEKAGIIKAGVPVVVGNAEGEVEKVFIDKAAGMAAPLVKAYESGDIQEFTHIKGGEGWIVDSKEFGTFTCDLAGEYQKENIRTVLAAIPVLRIAGIGISDSSIVRGLASVASSTGLQGRWQILAREPLTICDTGHNTGGLRWNIDRLEELRKSSKGTLRILMGFVADKNIGGILSMMPRDAQYYITNADIPRALPREELADKCRAVGMGCRTFDNVPDAYAAMRAEASGSDILYIGGSTFIVADLLASLAR